MLLFALTACVNVAQFETFYSSITACVTVSLYGHALPLFTKTACVKWPCNETF